MKTRLDYVSNSSSSSFFIIGKEVSDDDIKEAIEHLGLVPEDYDASDFIENVMPEHVSLRGKYDYEQEWGYIGMNWDDMKDDETKAQFLDRISKEFEKLFGYEVVPDQICTEIYD